MHVSGRMRLKNVCDRRLQQLGLRKVMAPLYSVIPKCWIKFWVMYSKGIEDQRWQIGFMSSVDSSCFWLHWEVGWEGFWGLIQAQWETVLGLSGKGVIHYLYMCSRLDDKGDVKGNVDRRVQLSHLLHVLIFAHWMLSPINIFICLNTLLEQG